MGQKLGRQTGTKKTNCKDKTGNQRFGAWEVKQNVWKMSDKPEGQSFRYLVWAAGNGITL